MPFPGAYRGPKTLVYLIAQITQLETITAQEILELDRLGQKMHALINALTKIKELLALGHKIRMAFYPVERVDEVLDLVLKPASAARPERQRLPGDLEGLFAA